MDLQHGSLFLQTSKIVADKGRQFLCVLQGILREKNFITDRWWGCTLQHDKPIIRFISLTTCGADAQGLAGYEASAQRPLSYILS